VKQILPTASVAIIPNGEELMKLLTPTNSPDILFLDINMPLKDGLSCLVEIRGQSHFSKLPIVVFSSANQSKIVDQSYDHGANLYYSKPASFSQLIAGMNQLFQMNWNDPFTITANHYVNNRFVSFSPSGIS
jgi:CheY-like chemotaxis protein